ncbi:MAG: metallophosphoesterase [Lachnospiraceae bacterium]|nr:metallophosphoesterase [Lachnospiraceae bacterium]
MKTLKILFIADEPAPALWDYFEESRLEGIDLIISCGDLPPQYLSFLATFFVGPVLYIYGNHDESYIDTPPDGCTCIDGKVFEFEGVRIAGLGGCMKYNYGTFQYTERQMFFRSLKLQYRLRKHKGLDIFVSHAPAYELNDGKDLPHMGFRCFHRLLEKYHPKFFVHGHVHLNYNYLQKRICTHEDTTVINAFERYILEYPLPEISV